MPQLNTEDERTAAGFIVEDRLDRRIGKDAAIPVEFAIGVDRRKRRRQRSGRHDLLDNYSGPTTVKIMHHAGPDIRGFRLSMIEQSTNSASVSRGGAVG